MTPRMLKNLSLSMMVRNEAEWLAKTLPTVAPWFGSKIAVDTGSSDGTIDVLTAHGFKVCRTKWMSDFGMARNTLLNLVRSLTAEPWTLMLDADEAMMPEDLDKLDDACAHTKKDLLTLPRWNFTLTTDWVNVKTYPDRQARVLRTSAPLEFRNKVHEVVCYADSKAVNAVGEGRDEFIPNAHIYHYGATKPPSNVWLRSENYQRISRGEPEMDAPPYKIAQMTHGQFFRETFANPDIEMKPFQQPHPLGGNYGA